MKAACMAVLLFAWIGLGFVVVLGVNAARDRMDR